MVTSYSPQVYSITGRNARLRRRDPDFRTFSLRAHRDPPPPLPDYPDIPELPTYPEIPVYEDPEDPVLPPHSESPPVEDAPPYVEPPRKPRPEDDIGANIGEADGRTGFSPGVAGAFENVDPVSGFGPAPSTFTSRFAKSVMGTPKALTQTMLALGTGTIVPRLGIALGKQIGKEYVIPAVKALTKPSTARVTSRPTIKEPNTNPVEATRFNPREEAGAFETIDPTLGSRDIPGPVERPTTPTPNWNWGEYPEGPKGDYGGQDDSGWFGGYDPYGDEYGGGFGAGYGGGRGGSGSGSVE